MTMRDDLERVIAEVRQADASQSDYDLAHASDDAMVFIRDHGTALAEVVRDAERMNWVENQAHCLDWQDGEPVRRVVRAEDGAEFHSPNSWREAIDAARGIR